MKQAIQCNEDGYYEIGHAEILAILHAILKPKHVQLVNRAYEQAKRAHGKQLRANGVRYFEHPKSVLMMLICELRITEWRYLVCGLLHDVVEDSFLHDYETIGDYFGQQVVNAIALVTKHPKQGYYERLEMFGTPLALIVKLCDRLQNMRSLGARPRDKQLEQVTETRQLFLPMADKLYTMLSLQHQWRAVYLKDQLVALCNKFA